MKKITSNPLLEKKDYIEFSKIKPEHIVPAVNKILKRNRQKLTKLLQGKDFDWKLIDHIEKLSNDFHKVWGPVEHLHAVVNNQALRDAHNACLPKISAYATELSHNTKLYQAIKSIADSPQYKKLTAHQQKIIENNLRDFRLAGIALNAYAKKRFAKLNDELAELGNKFSENVLDATQGWTKLVTQKSMIANLPKHEIVQAKILAEQNGLKGWLFTLNQPSYLAIMMYAKSRKLREEFYTAYYTRASDQGPNAKKWDNSKIMEQILQKRTEQAKLLKFPNYAEYSLTPKMARNAATVLKFLNELLTYAKNAALSELEELRSFAKKEEETIDLQSWDVPYYSEKLKQHKHKINEEILREYFPLHKVLEGMFELVNKLFAIKIEKHKKIDAWHKDVQVFDLYKDSQLLASFYFDPYARANKQSGAWMGDCQSRWRINKQNLQKPIAYIVCNFAPPIDKETTFLTHHEVLTLFHEFGHSLQHMLTQVDYLSISGINGIPWDAIELASQFMEHWCWEKTVLDLITSNRKTGRKLPKTILTKLIASKNFQAAMQTVRQIELALFDMRLHVEFAQHKKDQIQTILDDVRKLTALLPPPKFNRFQHGFSHIFAGGYAAGYYSYKWSEVLACDAFAKFLEDGIFNQETGAKFLHNILETGGSADPLILFEQFRGRAPTVEALLKFYDLAK